MASRRSNNSQYRDVNGVLLLNKPTGITSNRVLQQLRRRFQARKAGHSGTLDPMATGLLPICFGEATKFSTQLLNANKSYEFTCQLGLQTSTGDMEGNIIHQVDVPTLSDSLLHNILTRFLGEQLQTPPMVSALHHEGKRLYELARDGIEVTRQPRLITIHKLDLLSLNPTQQQFSARVCCSKGTYVRTLAEDIANALGTVGHLITLHRTAIEPFSTPIMHTFETLMDESQSLIMLDQYLLPSEIAIMDWPALTLNAEDTCCFQHGQRITTELLTDTFYRVYNSNQQFIGTAYRHDATTLAPQRLVQSS